MEVADSELVKARGWDERPQHALPRRNATNDMRALASVAGSRLYEGRGGRFMLVLLWLISFYLLLYFLTLALFSWFIGRERWWKGPYLTGVMIGGRRRVHSAHSAIHARALLRPAIVCLCACRFDTRLPLCWPV